MQQHYCFFDLETTGTSTTDDRIVEISAIRTDLNFQRVGDPLKYYINPEQPIPAGATAVHGVSDEMVKDAPKFKDLAAKIEDYFAGCILAGYNIMQFDVPLLSEEFARAGIVWPSSKPVMVDAFKIFQLKEQRTLSYALMFYTGKEMDGAHQAENDNVATIDILAGQMKKYEDLQGMSVEEVAKFCSNGNNNVDLAGNIVYNENGVPVYSFGKCKGVPVVNDRGYASWMLNQKFPSDTKRIIKELLGMK